MPRLLQPAISLQVGAIPKEVRIHQPAAAAVGG